MRRNGLAGTTVSLALVVALAACTSTVGGSGAARQPTAPASSQTSAAAVSTPPVSSATSTSAAPTPVAPPAECPSAGCPISDTVGLSNGYLALLRQGIAAGGYPQSSVLELTDNGVPVFWAAADGDQPMQLACATHNGTGGCVVVDQVGVHAATATAYAFDGSMLHRGSVADGNTPEAFARDLDGNGTLDVAALQNDYQPDYATGQVQWQTWRSDGSTLTSTGCTPLASTAPPRPTAFASGHCDES